MEPPKRKAPVLAHQGLNTTHCKAYFNTAIRPGSYRWRKNKGLLTISDRVFIYRSIRSPRGCYQTPLADDLI